MNILIGSHVISHEYIYPVLVSSFLSILRMYRNYKGIRLFITEVLSCTILQMALVSLLIYYKLSAEACLFSGAVTGLLGTRRIVKISEVIILRKYR